MVPTAEGGYGSTRDTRLKGKDGKAIVQGVAAGHAMGKPKGGKGLDGIDEEGDEDDEDDRSPPPFTCGTSLYNQSSDRRPPPDGGSGGGSYSSSSNSNIYPGVPRGQVVHGRNPDNSSGGSNQVDDGKDRQRRRRAMNGEGESVDPTSNGGAGPAG